MFCRSLATIVVAVDLIGEGVDLTEVGGDSSHRLDT